MGVDHVGYVIIFFVLQITSAASCNAQFMLKGATAATASPAAASTRVMSPSEPTLYEVALSSGQSSRVTFGGLSWD